MQASPSTESDRTTTTANVEAQEIAHSPPHDAEKDFTVQWDGDDDPMNPRSMSYARKWMVTLVIAFSSFCV